MMSGTPKSKSTTPYTLTLQIFFPGVGFFIIKQKLMALINVVFSFVTLIYLCILFAKGVFGIWGIFKIWMCYSAFWLFIFTPVVCLQKSKQSIEQ